MWGTVASSGTAGTNDGLAGAVEAGGMMGMGSGSAGKSCGRQDDGDERWTGQHTEASGMSGGRWGLDGWGLGNRVGGKWRRLGLPARLLALGWLGLLRLNGPR